MSAHPAELPRAVHPARRAFKSPESLRRLQPSRSWAHLRKYGEQWVKPPRETSPAPANPRRHEEHCRICRIPTPDNGLIPARAGSTAVRHGRDREPDRLIPAGAGSTRAQPVVHVHVPAHPRRRGEHVGDCRAGQPEQGSSPQARGARRHTGHVGQLGRLIPAGAGSTAGPAPPPKPRGAHPRRRGEHMAMNATEVTGAGSSPQARGARCRPER